LYKSQVFFLFKGLIWCREIQAYYAFPKAFCKQANMKKIFDFLMLILLFFVAGIIYLYQRLSNPGEPIVETCNRCGRMKKDWKYCKRCGSKRVKKVHGP
jgi:lipopolysaccharide/colanic/teichoic acid biosynthesis glycosyltransferase